MVERSGFDKESFSFDIPLGGNLLGQSKDWSNSVVILMLGLWIDTAVKLQI